MASTQIETEGWEFADWIQANTRAITIGAVIVAIAAGGWWFYARSEQIKRTNAERGLNQAKQSLAAGNAALAQTDLQRVATRYKGTPPGAQAAMILAQIHYDQGKFGEGLAALEPYQNSGAAGESLASIWSLTADGQLGDGKAEAAAQSYGKAADATAQPGAKAMYRAQSARAFMAAGKPAEARAVWEDLADDEFVPVRTEAQLRLGELTAAAAK